MRIGLPGRIGVDGFSRGAIVLILAILAVTYVLLLLRFSTRPPEGILSQALDGATPPRIEKSVRALHVVEGPLGGIWAGCTLNDLRRHDGAVWRSVPFDLDHAGNPTITSMVAFDGGLAVSTRREIYRWFPVERRRRSDPKARSDWDCLTVGQRRFHGGRIVGLLALGRLLMAASPRGLHLLGPDAWYDRDYPPDFPKLVATVSLHLVGKSIVGLLSGTSAPKLFRFTKASGFSVMDLPEVALAPGVPTHAVHSAGALWILQQEERLGLPPPPTSFLRCSLDRHGVVASAEAVALPRRSAVLGMRPVHGGVILGFLDGGLHVLRGERWTELPRPATGSRPFVPEIVDGKDRLWARADWTEGERMVLIGSGLALLVFGLLLLATTVFGSGRSEVASSAPRRRFRKICSGALRVAAIVFPAALWGLWPVLVNVLPQANLVTPYRHALPVLSGLLLGLGLLGLWAERRARARADADLALRSFPSAAQVYEDRIGRGSRDPMDYVALARCYGELGIKLNDALLVLDGGAQLTVSPLVIREIQLVRGFVFLRLGQRYDAVAELGRAIEGFLTDLPPGHGSEKAAEGFCLLGEALQGTNDLARARQAWERGVEVDPVGTMAARCRRHLEETA